MDKRKALNEKYVSVKQPVDLPWTETWAYAIIFVGSYAYSFYTVFVFSKEKSQNLNKSSLSEGWLLIGRKKDISDFEWQFWKQLLTQIWPLYTIHITVSQACRYWNYKKRHVILLVVDLLAVGYIITYKALLYQVFVCATIVGVASVSRSVTAVWFTSFVHLFGLQMVLRNPQTSMAKEISERVPTTEESEEANKNTNQNNKGKIASITDSHKLTEEENSPGKTYSPMDFLSYAFYFPFFFTGPIYTYDRFYKETHSPIKPWTKKELISLAVDIVRVAFWSFFLELWVHYFYIYSIQRHLNLMREIPYWILGGVGYQVGHFFQLKYISLFGIPINIAKLDGLTPFGTPRCGIYVYKFSEMWRNFDQGLHAFVIRHIYFPLGGSRRGLVRQLIATVICYIFVFTWHGLTFRMFIWAVLNFLNIVIEAVAKFISRWPAFINFETKYIYPRWGRRLRGLFWTPVLMMNYISSLIFFSGETISPIYAYRFFIEGFPVTYLTFVLVFFCQIQTSMEYANYRSRKKLKTD